jgi:hypothetical protein
MWQMLYGFRPELRVKKERMEQEGTLGQYNQDEFIRLQMDSQPLTAASSSSSASSSTSATPPREPQHLSSGLTPAVGGLQVSSSSSTTASPPANPLLDPSSPASLLVAQAAKVAIQAASMQPR